MGFDRSMGEVWSHFSEGNCGAGKSVFQTQEIPRFAAADSATIVSTESGLFPKLMTIERTAGNAMQSNNE